MSTTPDFLTLMVWAVSGSPALWPLDEFRRRGYEEPKHHVCPDHAEFDIWIETPGTGWYEMCQQWGMPGYDGIHPAIAIELDRCWLSWDQSSDSLAARLTRHERDV